MSRRSNRTHERYEPRRIIDPGRVWYVAATFAISGWDDDETTDRKADAALRKADVDVWMPQREVLTIRRGRKVSENRLFLPGYLFAGCVTDDTDVLRSCRFVQAVLGIDKPIAIPHGVMQAIADQFTGDVKSERIQAAALYQIGELMRVASGPFASFFAIVTELLSSGHVKGDVSIFGRETPVVFEPDQLERA